MPQPNLNLSHDPVHGYIPFVGQGSEPNETCERDVIDHPWVQRLRFIHQLQTAWWVFPSAEHSRFQHVLGVMHLASRVIAILYDSLVAACDKQGEPVPSRGYVETLLRMAGLLHDVGHGPFGHFLDDHFLADHGLTHESLGAAIIRGPLADLLCGVRRNPHSELSADERIDPAQIAWLITRPTTLPQGTDPGHPLWLKLLRTVLSGIYTIDNMDFVLRDAYMTGYSTRSFDIDRLLHYSFFTPQGLTIHDRGVDALMRFMTVRAELFRTVYFHRTVRAIDLMLADLFADSKQWLFTGNPLTQLDQYQQFTDASLLVDVARWPQATDPAQQAVGRRWQGLLRREITWKMVCQRNLLFSESESERASIFSEPGFVETRLREALPPSAANVSLRVDIARHIYRPHTRGPALHQNFLFDSGRNCVRPLTDYQLFRHLPISQRICRVYAQEPEFGPTLTAALDRLIGPSEIDSLTNM